MNKEVQILEDLEKVVTGETSGKVICELCNDLIYYGSKVFTAISEDLKRENHVDKVRRKLSNFTVPSDFFSLVCCYIKSEQQFFISTIASKCTTLCQSYKYSVFGTLSVGKEQLAIQHITHTYRLSKTLASDKKALNHLSTARTTASYKMRHGLAKYFIKEMSRNLKSRKFLLNIDEATSKQF